MPRCPSWASFDGNYAVAAAVPVVLLAVVAAAGFWLLIGLACSIARARREYRRRRPQGEVVDLCGYRFTPPEEWPPGAVDRLTRAIREGSDE